MGDASGRGALAPTGMLRVGLNLGNSATVTQDAATGELRGVAVALGRALAGAIGVALTPVVYPTVAYMVEAATAGAWDVAFLAVDPARMVDMVFTPPYMEVENTYLVPPGSAIQTMADVDQPGMRVAVQQSNAPDLFLSRTLRHAALVRSTTGDEAAFALLRAGQAHVLASGRAALLGYAATWPGARVLDGRFLAVEHAIAIPKGQEAGLRYLRDFVEEAKRSGMVQQAIDRSGVRGVRVAPAAAGE